MSHLLPAQISTPERLNDRDFVDAAAALGCDVAAIRAVAEVESPKGPFLPSGRPAILFEAHIFSARTGHKYDKTHPLISSRKWDRTLYRGGEKEYLRIEQAIKLNARAALESASWGRWQIMGFNHRVCGFQTVEAFVSAMYASERRQLDAFVGYVRGRNLDDEIRRLDWAGFAFGFNGPAYAENQYDKKMANAYAKYRRGSRLHE